MEEPDDLEGRLDLYKGRLEGLEQQVQRFRERLKAVEDALGSRKATTFRQSDVPEDETIEARLSRLESIVQG